MKFTGLFIKPLWIIFIVFLTGTSVGSQDLLSARQSSFYTYIFQLSDQEARKIYKNDLWVVDTTFFHSLVDSFPTDSAYKGALPEGHYLKASTKKNRLFLSITTVQPFELFIMNNTTDLSVQMVDLIGSVIPDADIRVGWKRLRFDEETQSYVDKKSNCKGLLTVTHNGFTAYYNLDRQWNNPAIKRGAQKVLYSVPLRYVWIPVRFVVMLPVDAVKLAFDGYPSGTMYQVSRFFVRLFNATACIFDDYYCDAYPLNNFSRKHRGYIVFNKPKYQPGDTVMFKAFLVRKNGKPVNKPVTVKLHSYRKSHDLTTLKPYREGGYEYRFLLHDSLALDLDSYYYITLQRNERKQYISGSFKYEDYELAGNKLSVRLERARAEHYRDAGLKLYVKGIDENELSLMDANISLLVTPDHINKSYVPYSFFPDTLLFLRKPLEPSGETVLLVDDSLFPKADFSYDLTVTMATSDNEIQREYRIIQYFYESGSFDIQMINDSLSFRYLKNGVSVERDVTICANDNSGRRHMIYNGLVPYTIRVNPNFASYSIEYKDQEETFVVAQTPSMLQCIAERDSDSVSVVVDNPRNITFSYSIYRGNKEIAAGYGDSLEFYEQERSKQSYYISIRYLWGGKVNEKNFPLLYFDKKLNVAVKQPDIIYPGQHSLIEVFVTDQKGRPVPDVDVTAFGLTKKFNYSPPKTPYLGKIRGQKKMVNEFFFQKQYDWKNGFYLDYATWKVLAGLDTIAYYNFIYPRDSIYRFSYPVEEGITQFAPFVMSHGSMQPVNVVYVDNKPVYFSWSTNQRPYSFAVDSGYHQIILRTPEKHIIFDSLYFEPGKKLIFSLNDKESYPGVTITDAEPFLSDVEQQQLFRYVFPYRHNFNDRYAFIEQENHIQSLMPESSIRYIDNYAGPVSGDITLHFIDSFAVSLKHEPFFEYELAPPVLKMRSVSKYPLLHGLNNYHPDESLTDLVLTKEKLVKEWNNYILRKKGYCNIDQYIKIAPPGFGTLYFRSSDHEESGRENPINVVLLRYDDTLFKRVYRGSTRIIRVLREGYHRLILFYPGAGYHAVDSLYIRPNGINFYQIDLPETYQKDSLSTVLYNMIEAAQYTPKKHKNMTLNSYEYHYAPVVTGGVPSRMGEFPVRGSRTTDLMFISAESQSLSEVHVVSYQRMSSRRKRRGDFYGGFFALDTSFPDPENNNQGTVLDDMFDQRSSQPFSIRNNFSDYAFWQPTLRTDTDGKASFDVIFPDDVTGWETHFLAMNGKRQSGQLKSFVRSYKPLMAQLAVPRFMVHNDTALVIGKVLNYLSDTVEINTTFSINDVPQVATTRKCSHALIDTLPVIAAGDSVTLTYTLDNANGYFDGEQRAVKVFPLGLEETKGSFFMMNNDTVISLSFDTTLGEVFLFANADILSVLEDEIDHVLDYKYQCNEQIASKLKALLAKRSIMQYRNDKFREDNTVNKLIKLLVKNRTPNGLWGWWKDAEENKWISLHVIEALLMAETYGYQINIDKQQLTGRLLWELDMTTAFSDKVRILMILKLFDATVGYNTYINTLEKTGEMSFNDKLLLVRLKQMVQQDYNLDFLWPYRKETIMGNICFSDTVVNDNLLVNDIQNTLLAYKIIDYDSTLNDELLMKVRNYFLEVRRSGYWRNTYESAQIIETIMPGLAKSAAAPSKPMLMIDGDISKTITQFPFSMQIKPHKNIMVSCSGDFPVYFTAYQKYWNESPVVRKNDFEITTRMHNDAAATLIAGQPVSMIAEVLVKKEAQYVMIELPIPAGCTYAEKPAGHHPETHREYFRNETVIFCEHLPVGKYSFEIPLIPRYAGVYSLNPAKVSLMYFPLFRANNTIKTSIVK